MPDIRTRVETYTNAGGDGATFGTNFEKHFINTSDAGRELVVKIDRVGGTDPLTNDHLLAVYRQLTQIGEDGDTNRRNGPDAGTFAAIGTADGSDFTSGTTTAVFARLQTTGTPDTSDIVVSGANLQITVVAHFAPRF